MSKHLFTVLVSLLLLSVDAMAVKVGNLYEVQVSVASQAADARAEAIREGFRDVLIKLTGSQNIVNNKLIKASIERADYYVLEFSYSAPSVNAATYFLNIKYNEPDIKRLLSKVGAQAWSARRPLILVWLATVNDRHEVDILGTDSRNDLLEKFKRQGQRFGLPLIFPVMDVTDMEKIQSDYITSVAIPELKVASKRYEPDALLVGTIEHNDDVYQARWDLVWNDKVWNWSTSGETQEKVIADELNNISQALSGRREAKQS